jgi:hypothetical protein
LPAHYGFWKALTGCFAAVTRLWEGPRYGDDRGSFSLIKRPEGHREEDDMAATVGDRVEVQPKRAQSPGRTGTIEAVLSESPPRYEVRWDDGRSSIISATDGALHVAPPKKRPRSRQTATRPKTKS